MVKKITPQKKRQAQSDLINLWSEKPHRQRKVRGVHGEGTKRQTRYLYTNVKPTLVNTTMKSKYMGYEIERVTVGSKVSYYVYKPHDTKALHHSYSMDAARKWIQDMGGSNIVTKRKARRK